MIQIIAIGKKHEPWLADAITRYEKRLRAPYDIKWHLLAHSSLQGTQARQEESTRIITALPAEAYVVLLDERGTLLRNEQLVTMLRRQINTSRQIVLIIGGAYGVTEELQQRASLVWSLAPLVFPHQIVRLLVTEQLYRVQSLEAGSSYHHA